MRRQVRTAAYPCAMRSSHHCGAWSITFPMFVWGSAQRGIPPQVNVVGTVMFLVALLLVLGGSVFQRRRPA